MAATLTPFSCLQRGALLAYSQGEHLHTGGPPGISGTHCIRWHGQSAFVLHAMRPVPLLDEQAAPGRNAMAQSTTDRPMASLIVLLGVRSCRHKPYQ